jgi:hypothetical protein
MMSKRATPHTESDLTESPASRRKLDTSLRSVPNDLDDATHARMDDLVLETAEDEPSNLTLAAFLLATIVSTSEGRLDSKYKANPSAKNLLRGDPNLVEMLKLAWMEKSFKAIRNLGKSSSYSLLGSLLSR